MSYRSFGLAGASVAVVILSGLLASRASAETCLQRFSCKLYGECRFPCLDDVLGTRPAAAEAATKAPAAPSSDTGRKVAAQEPHHPRVAHHEAATPPRLAAARDIGSVENLAGRPVSFGPDGSPSQAMGRKLFARLGIKVAETPLDLDNALDGVATGDIAAVLLVKPRDVARLKTSGATHVHLLAVPSGVVAKGG